MNKYKDFQKADGQDAVLNEIMRKQMEAARMHKPGYRRKMRRTKNKHTRNASR